MATVTVSFTALPSHVRTARFIAASVARRAGVAENVLDEVRLAVSEACSLAVRLHRVEAPDSPVEMRLTDDADQFVVQVVDAVARPKPPEGDGPVDLSDDAGAVDHPAIGQLTEGLGPEESRIDLRARERIGLAVIVGLVDDVEVEYLGTGSVVSMRWPISQDVPANAQPGSSNLF